LWGLVNDNAPKVHVTLSRDHDRRHPGLLIHRVRDLDPRDVTTFKRLRITSPARTILDFATDASIAEVEHALSEGRAQALITDAKLEVAIERAPGNRPGAAKLKALLRSRVARVITRSERERKLVKLLEAAGLPKPLVNRRLHGYVPDFYWPDHKLILEFDGHRTHGGRRSFEDDRRRDQTYAALGILTVRATWLQLEHEPVALVVRVGQALAARAA
jgi:very-short-patch-repair endonuclease